MRCLSPLEIGVFSDASSGTVKTPPPDFVSGVCSVVIASDDDASEAGESAREAAAFIAAVATDTSAFPDSCQNPRDSTSFSTSLQGEGERSSRVGVERPEPAREPHGDAAGDGLRVPPKRYHGALIVSARRCAVCLAAALPVGVLMLLSRPAPPASGVCQVLRSPEEGVAEEAGLAVLLSVHPLSGEATTTVSVEDPAAASTSIQSRPSGAESVASVYLRVHKVISRWWCMYQRAMR